jgi:hypothetical protein
VRKKRSLIYKLPADQFKKLLVESKTYSDVCRSFGISNRGGNIATIKRRILQEGLGELVSHYNNNAKFARIPKSLNLEEALARYFTKENETQTNILKKYVKQYNLLEEKCVCGLTDNWQNHKLVLQLDHINGDRRNNLLENLRFLCPNCHSQTPNYAGRKPKKAFREWRKDPRPNNRKVVRPDKEQLQNLLNEKSFVEIGKMYGVSNNSVRKWCKKYELI